MSRKIRVNKTRTNTCIECGVEYETKSGKSIYCSARCVSRVEYKDNMLDHKWRLRKTLAAAKYRARTKKLDFNIDLEYLLELWEDHCGCCCLTGRQLDLSSFGKYGQANPNAPSLDRIIPELGYTRGNVRLITYHMNVALSEFGEEVFEALARDYIGGIS